MALDFPTSPSVGQTYTAGSVVWQWDGAKWVNGVSAASVVSSWNARTGAVTLSSADVTAAGGALLAAPVFTGDARAVTPTAGDNDTSIATTAFVQAAQRYQNYVDNGGFSVNQRVYVSGTALAAGIYGHDRWKAGAGGCTYTFAAPAGPSNAITITAGSLQQVVDGASVSGGNYMLSWTGTAQGRVGAGSYAASPVAVPAVVAGANTTIEFNAGTLATVQFQMGTIVTGLITKAARDELANCQRFYQVVDCSIIGNCPGVGFMACSQPWPTMRAVPIATQITGGTFLNVSAATLFPETASGGRWQATTAAAGAFQAYGYIVGLTADL